MFLAFSNKDNNDWHKYVFLFIECIIEYKEKIKRNTL